MDANQYLVRIWMDREFPPSEAIELYIQESDNFKHDKNLVAEGLLRFLVSRDTSLARQFVLDFLGGDEDFLRDLTILEIVVLHSLSDKFAEDSYPLVTDQSHGATLRDLCVELDIKFRVSCLQVHLASKDSNSEEKLMALLDEIEVAATLVKANNRLLIRAIARLAGNEAVMNRYRNLLINIILGHFRDDVKKKHLSNLVETIVAIDAL